MRYRDLVERLGADQPVYGFEAPVGPDGRATLLTLEELADRYVRELRDRQPSGPYYLCGYCWAGALAFEMACQLRQAGQEVALLALIDSACPGDRTTTPLYRRARARARAFLARAGRNLRRLRELEATAMPGFLAERLTNLCTEVVGGVAYRWSRRLQRPLLPAFRDRRGALTQAGRRYRPAAYPGRVTLFRAASPSPGDDPFWGWGRVAAGGVELHEVAGEHLTLMHDPHVAELASRLRHCLDRARASCP
jgi:thioesterase domain-containing protein